MIINKKHLIVLPLVILLLVSFHTASAFSFKSFFNNIFGGNKTQNTQPAAAVSATPIEVPKEYVSTDIKTDTSVKPKTTAPVKDIPITVEPSTKPPLTLPKEKILFLSGGNNTNVATTGTNDVYASSDMYSWNLISPNAPTSTTKWSPRYFPETFYFNNKYWVIGDWTSGNQPAVNDIWSSPDGVSWALMNSNPPFKNYKEYRATVFNGKIYVTGGWNISGVSNANVWSSPDGITWTTLTTNAAFGPISRHMSFVFNGKIYVVGGDNSSTGTSSAAGTVWSSVDGINWIHEINNLPAVSDGGKALVYQNKIYLIGPSNTQNPTAGLNVWSSQDGSNWSFFNDTSIGVMASQFPDAVVASGKLWYQGLDSNNNNKLFSSANGINWTPSCVTLPWSPRYSHFNGMVSNGAIPANTPDPCVQPTSNITVTSPNGGEIYQAGQQITVTWTSQNIPSTDNVVINITSDQPSISGLSGLMVLNTGTAQFTLPSLSTLTSVGWSLGTHFKISIKHLTPAGSVDASDLSDNLFTINAPVISSSCSSYQYITQWGTQGTGNGQFDHPFGVTADPSGNIYVVDTYNNRIQKFTSNGTFVTKWGTNGFGNGQFLLPNDIAVDQSSSNVYVADNQNNRIQKFTSNGSFITEWGGLGQAQDVAIDSLTDVYGIDYVNNKIKKFTSNGTFITEWGTNGSGNGQFNWMSGIATDSSNNVYVADALNYRIQKFTSNGTYITQWGGFPQPADVTTDSSGDVYVLDTGNSGKIKKFTSNGTLITQWAAQGSGNGQLSGAESLTVDSLGNVYVADTYNNRIQKFGCTTTQIPIITVTSPNGGEVYQAGQQITVTWSSQNIPATTPMQISLEAPFPGGQSFPLNPLLVSGGIVLNSGSATFTLPIQGFGGINQWFQMQYGTYYKVKISQTQSSSGIFASDMSDNLFTINAPSTSSLCTINSFTVPASTTVASGLSVTTSWSSNCNNVVLEANSGSYTLRYNGGGSGTHTFVTPAGTTFSTADNAIDIALIASTASDTASKVKSVPITDISTPASNQCAISSLTATPNPIPTGSSSTTLSWQAPAGCNVFVDAWKANANNLTAVQIPKPGSIYFNATDSVVVSPSSATTYYISAQAGSQSNGRNTMVLSAKTIDVDKN